jgi:hypothetical protein
VTWLIALKYLKITAAFCRQHWRWLILLIAFVIVYTLGRNGADVYKLQASLAKEQYKKEKEAIEKAHEFEIKKREEANKRYSEAVEKIEKKHEEDKWNVTTTKKESVKKMIQKSKHSPEEIDRILEQELGIQKG